MVAMPRKMNEAAVAAVTGLVVLCLSRFTFHGILPDGPDAILVMAESAGLLYALKKVGKELVTDAAASMPDDKELISLVGAIAIAGALASHLYTLIEISVFLEAMEVLARASWHQIFVATGY